jgi:hypothetical protein
VDRHRAAAVTDHRAHRLLQAAAATDHRAALLPAGTDLRAAADRRKVHRAATAADRLPATDLRADTRHKASALRVEASLRRADR